MIDFKKSFTFRKKSIMICKSVEENSRVRKSHRENCPFGFWTELKAVRQERI